VTNEIKYTAQYCYNKERNKNVLSILFHNKKTPTLQEDTIEWQKYMYIKQNFVFQSKEHTIFEIYSTKQ